MHVIDTIWKPSELGGYESGILVWTKEGDFPEFVSLEPDSEITWNITGPRTCVGFRDEDGKRQRCPEKSIMVKGKSRCGPCSAMDYGDACIRCDGSICRASPERWEVCKNTHYTVYTALFGTSRIKVGVSTKRRVRTRWVEQGADYGAIIKEIVGGKEARQIESSIGQISGITKQVRTSTKQSILLAKQTEEAARERVEEIVDRLKWDNKNGIEIENLSGNYHLHNLETQPQIIAKGRKPIQDLKVVGTVIGMKGPIIITKVGATIQSLDLKRLNGYRIDSTQRIEVIAQTGLLDFV
ncbi:MAG: DUF2797 domain-containing protein [Candidatus Thorarchaeota archaeon]